MRLVKKIIALICVIAISLSCLVVPASAVDVGGVGGFVSGVADFGQWAIDSSLYGIKLIARIFDEDVCPERPGGVNTTHSFVVNTTTKDGVLADWYVCEYCGFNSGYKADSESLSAAYDDYVETLPAPSYTSDGSILWSPEISYAYIWFNSYRQFCPHYTGSYDKLLDSCISAFDCANRTLLVRPVAGRDNFLYPYFTLQFSGVYPIDGYYKLTKSLASNSTWIVNSMSGIKSFFYEAESSATLHYAGVSYDFSKRVADGSSASVQHASYSYYLPVYEVVPFDSGVGQVNNTYNINTRPTSITGGNYGIVGDNGQITKVEDNSTIINETNNTYYNPATGQTVPITGWSYDYSDRSYKVTLESGDTVTVTYGDENITIQEGDTIYNVYYLIDGSGSETPVDPPAACEHTWTETSTTPATCTMPGSKLSTCSKCQQTKKDPIPALGHDWQEKQTVTTQYDEEGQLVQKGYTIFECSRCGEQYKSEDGTGPPDTPPEDPGEEEEKKGFFSWLWSVLTDALKKLIEGIIDAILKTLDFFFGGDSQSNYDFYNSPSTFSGVSVWGS